MRKISALVVAALVSTLSLSAQANDKKAPAAAKEQTKKAKGKDAAKPAAAENKWCFDPAEGKEVMKDGDMIKDEKTCKEMEGHWVPKK